MNQFAYIACPALGATEYGSKEIPELLNDVLNSLPAETLNAKEVTDIIRWAVDAPPGAMLRIRDYGWIFRLTSEEPVSELTEL